MAELESAEGVLTSLAAPAPTISTQVITAGLLEPGEFWRSSLITYSIPGAGALWPGYGVDEENATFTPLNATQSANFVLALNAWDRVIAPNFLGVADGDSGQGAIRIGFTSYTDIEDAWGYSYGAPDRSSTPAPWVGDIWINAENKGEDFHVGGYDYQSLLHEVGHSLGLKHPFEGVELPAAYEHGRYTVMSYDDQVQFVVTFEVKGNSLQGRYVEVLARTPMVLDIAAVQSVYGADPNTALGNTTYTYRPDQPVVETIYDAGGIDTIDASAFLNGSDIDLTPGAYSSLGFGTAAQQIAAAKALYPYAADYVQYGYDNLIDDPDFGIQSIYVGKDAVGIAFSTTVENALGGFGADSLTGNAASNLLAGNGGNDFIRGLDGNDVVDGGAGDDDVNGNQGFDVVHGGDGNDTVRGGQSADTVYGDAGDDPHINGNIGDDLVFGGTGNDTLFGGQGADTLQGEDGDDWLSGDLGADVLVGGAGADRYLVRANGGADVAQGFDAAQGDRVQLATGTTYTVASQGGEAAIVLTGGDQLLLSGVSFASFNSSWVVFA